MADTGTTVLDFNPLDPAHRADPYPLYHRLRETAPVYRSPQGFWLLSRYRDGAAALRDPRLGHGTRQQLDSSRYRRTEAGRSLPFILQDPPEHTRMRSLVSKAFTPRVVAGMQGRIDELVDGLIDRMLEAGQADLINDFGYPLPATVISEMLGVPVSDQENVKEWSHAIARGIDPDFQHDAAQQARRREAFAGFDGYFRELLAERRRQPTGDLLSRLVTVQDGDSRLTEPELLTTCVLLYVAGHETTMDLLGNGALALMRHPDQLAALRADPALDEPAVEELLRFDTPTQLTRRTVLEDLEIDGHPIRQGEVVIVLRGAANRDPEVFADPDRLDLARKDNRHLSFDGGIHYCIGAALARMEGRTALGRLVRRAPRLELATDELVYRDNLTIRGLATLPVRLT